MLVFLKQFSNLFEWIIVTATKLSRCGEENLDRCIVPADQT